MADDSIGSMLLLAGVGYLVYQYFQSQSPTIASSGPGQLSLSPSPANAPSAPQAPSTPSQSAGGANPGGISLAQQTATGQTVVGTYGPGNYALTPTPQSQQQPQYPMWTSNDPIYKVSPTDAAATAAQNAAIQTQQQQALIAANQSAYKPPDCTNAPRYLSFTIC